MTPDQYARVKELFASVLQLDPDQRATFVQQHAAGDPEVQAEVESLLAHHANQTLLPVESDTARMSSVRTEKVTSLGRQRIRILFQAIGPSGQLAVGIGLACVLLGAVMYAGSPATRLASHQLRESVLRSSLESTVRAIELWIEQEETRVKIVARDPEIRRHTAQLIELFPDETNAKALAESPAQANIRDQLRASLGNDVRYAIWDRRYLTIADWNEDALAIGRGVTASGAALLSQVLEGRTIIQMPGIGESITKDYPLDLRQSRIGIFTPIQDDQGRNLAALLIYGLGAQRRFNEILSIVQIGKTGETYAFDRNGLMISNSRFQDQLAGLGLLAGQPNTVSASRVRVCDPGGDLIAGFRPDSPPATWPLTKMARFATAGENGIDLDGYRDYRGATVVGAWKWLAPYDFGVAMEIELDEVNRPLLFLRTESLAVLGLLSVSLIVAMRSYQRLQRLRHQIGSQRQLGQYTLEEKIGEGGMGIVFRARHALLKRPTAIKLLKAELANARTIAWFEREVQLASQLTHPNTIEIYDYGVTPEGVFYYVMEFLDGTTLEQLVRREGPLDSPRVVLILQQIAGSLREAHSMGLVHRDIKPHNIMLCRRGGENDVVKVLDFGLVKQIHGPEATSHTVLAGTPMYMAPERLDAPQENDPRADIYAFGAVGFFLLTGREIFLDDGVHGILHDVLNTVPPRTSTVSPRGVPAALDELISRCLAKQPDQRPPNMDAVLKVLREIPASD